MFSKGKKDTSAQNSSPASAPKKRVPPSIISADLTITGNLVSEGEVQIDGTLKGDVKSKNLLVGEGALIQGEIIADTIRVHGKVDGQIKALNVSLAKSAHVVGDILHDNLSIETGAFLEGHCKRLSKGEFDQMAKRNQEAPTLKEKAPETNDKKPMGSSAPQTAKATA